MKLRELVDQVNPVLRPLGLVVRSLAAEHVAGQRAADEVLVMWRRLSATREELRETRIALGFAAGDAARHESEAERLRRHLRELDGLLAGVGQSEASRACRRVVDVAFGRDVERAA